MLEVVHKEIAPLTANRGQVQMDILLSSAPIVGKATTLKKTSMLRHDLFRILTTIIEVILLNNTSLIQNINLINFLYKAAHY